MSGLKTIFPPMFLLLLLLLMALPVPALDGPDWTVHDMTLAGYNDRSELCLSLAAGEHLEFALDAAHSVEVMVRRTRNTVVRRLVQGKAQFFVPAKPAGEYCLTVTHLEKQAGPFRVPVHYRVAAAPDM